jgi:N-methylhydantoinase A
MGERDVSIIAIDTGGTFTDVVWRHAGGVRVLKVPSTPDDPSRAVLTGIAQALRTSGIAAGPDAGTTSPGPTPPAFLLLHGSTVATNALLERRGARVALITNAGFEDVIEIGRQNRPQLYALTGHRPAPLVAREDRHGVRGRIGPGGEEIDALADADIASLAARLTDADSIAVCLLHSYANPSHERRVADALSSLGRPVSVSCELLPEFREYERTATTVVNAYVAPLMDRYLGRIEAESGAERVRIMGSGGGAIPVSRARREPVHTVLSGPAGGVMGALAVAARAGIDRILTFDMGGTSTDVSLCPGRPEHTREFSIAGLPVAVPVLDIHTVGAGGGSIARIDAGGALQVGPESAGAEPGPICYGLGGQEVTVTDANVWLGRLPVSGWEHSLSSGDEGGSTLDLAAIREPLEAIARGLGTDPDAAAEGVVLVANAAMERALRVISVERGHDPADFTLVPFGGAAGLHAAALAERLGIPRLLVPPDPGVLSAFGMLVAPVRKDVSRTVLWEAPAADRIGPAFDEMEARARAAMEAEGIPTGLIEVNRWIDARYRGQSFELTVPSDGWVESFHRAHESRYGYNRRDAIVEAVTLRVEALAAAAAVVPETLAAAAAAPVPASTTEVSSHGRRFDTPVYDRRMLRTGHTLVGPCIVVEYSSTLWLPAGWTADVLEDGSLLALRAAA